MRNGKYILITASRDYPGKRYRGRYVYEHQFVWWENTGQLVPGDSVVHHKNDDKHDNRFENLEVMKKSDHTALHQIKIVPMTCLQCNNCEINFCRETRYIKSKLKIGQERFYCGRSCQVKDQQKRRREKLDAR